MRNDIFMWGKPPPTMLLARRIEQQRDRRARRAYGAVETCRGTSLSDIARANTHLPPLRGHPATPPIVQHL